MEIKIKPASNYDLAACALALKNSALAAAYFPTDDARINAVKEAIDSGNTYAAFCGRECVGFAYYIEYGAFHSFHYIHLIAVNEAYRGKGIGRKLLEFVEEKLFETRDKVFLVVGDYNPEGRAFYEKSGYVCVGTVPGLYRDGIAEHIMMKVKQQ